MNSKPVLKVECDCSGLISDKGFDYQLIRSIDCNHTQPGLRQLVRLFFANLPFWAGWLLNMKKQFAVFHVAEKQVLLGSNHQRYEIRLSFYIANEFKQKIVVCFATSHLDLIGYFQSLYTRLIIRFLLPTIFASLEVSLKKQSTSSR